MISTIFPAHFTQYELIDSGDFQKLERFGNYITIRPEPQAIWNKKISDAEWKSQAHVQFESLSSSSGKWNFLKKMPENWLLNYQHNGLDISFNLALTKFKHVGIFPEQSVNWDYIFQRTAALKSQMEHVKVLNLFAYTGGASLAATAGGAETFHVDSIKQVVSWANRNMESSKLKDIRWVVEDAVKFVKRELKRGKIYQGIILDPPAYGHGTDGEKWKLEDQINEMVFDTLSLLDKENHFYLLNTYSLGFSSLIIENIISDNLSKTSFNKVQPEYGELYIPSTTEQKLPLGVYCRF
ncbi:MAG TPA: class I SAM-dependent methyltransferase [Chitinophagales bacterium]|jgi:23S rRNA (cytosine1962-C5)-methyltransferase|nr:class I SAM-dependent methyltransferase [Chitinophagales bacterium]MBP6153379.1 class I SAM-dependent methyltransferase [Chitinophagales bacterium]HQV77456.1 class I SAM-dependent methyltransferase [Chitinophagales bacterium]HQW78518.1 class I SAM-dependent methyltransferase [Chitinophagales bacterium]HRB18661.1 class I SAM-dependent methyltransferase [Chitinophagales bacterium]